MKRYRVYIRSGTPPRYLLIDASNFQTAICKLERRVRLADDLDLGQTVDLEVRRIKRLRHEAPDIASNQKGDER